MGHSNLQSLQGPCVGIEAEVVPGDELQETMLSSGQVVVDLSRGQEDSDPDKVAESERHRTFDLVLL